ncbi:hypothetical protein V6N13_007673 [Hibiscus sabdariffa]
MKRRGLKPAVLSRCSKTLAWSFNNGGSESPRVLCPKSIREYSLHVCVRAAAGNAMWATKCPHSIFSALCLFRAQECYSIPATMGVLSCAETAGLGVHV